MTKLLGSWGSPMQKKAISLLCLNDPVPIQLRKICEGALSGLQRVLLVNCFLHFIVRPKIPLPCSDTVHALPTDPRVETGFCTTSSERTEIAYWVSGGPHELLVCRVAR